MKKKIWALMAMTAILISCSGNKKGEAQEEVEKPRTLVLYYSQTGATKTVAETLQKMLNADIDSIVPVESYGYDYDATIERWLKEKKDSVKIAVKPLGVNVENYDTIFLGFPIWGGTYATPVNSYLSDNSLEGKTIITFATFGSGGIEEATKNVAKVQPAAHVAEGYGVRNARINKAPAEIRRFLIEKGYVQGEAAPIPPFSATETVTPEETKIFNEACGDYKFPLGTPVSVAKTSYGDTVCYKYNVVSSTPDGKEVHSVIYVQTVPNEKPEFTRVVRE